jgi:hypothetical protein
MTGCWDDGQDVGKLREEMEAAINKYDFATARAKAGELDRIASEEKYGYYEDFMNENRLRVANAEVAYYINEGEYDVAGQIAMEMGVPDGYYNKVFPNLITIYEKQGSTAVITAISSITLPVAGVKWGEISFRGAKQEWLDFHTTHNSHLQRLMEYMQMSGSEDYKKIALFLSAECNGGEAEVKKIKAKFGLK